MARHGIGRRAANPAIFGIGRRIAGLVPSGVWKAVSASVAVAVLSATLVIAPNTETAHAATRATAQTHHDDIRTIYEGTNAIRKAAGKSNYKYDVRLTVVAYDWSVKMGVARYMAHNPRYSAQIPSKWLRAGENVAYACGYGDKTAEVIVENWKKSPGHYRNLTGDFTSIGIGVYWHGNCMYATQNFAKYSDAPSCTLPKKSKDSSDLIKANYSSQFKTELSQAKAASANAQKHLATASKSLKQAKKHRDKAKTYARSKKATAKTRAQYAKAAKEYGLAVKDYASAKKAAKTAKTYYSRVKSNAVAGKTASVRTFLSYSKTQMNSTKKARDRVVAHQKRTASFAKAAKVAMRK